MREGEEKRIIYDKSRVGREMVSRKKEKWARLDLSADPDLLDALSNFMEEIGAAGVSQEAPPLPGDDSPAAVLYECLTAYFPWEDREEYVAQLETYIGDLERIFPMCRKIAFSIQQIASTDWEEGWKKYFHPLRIGGHFIVKPTWEPYKAAEDDIVIEIDPGMAFGTGQHYSTAMCLEALEEIFAHARKCGHAVPGEILDVGTGTGILGIAAVKLGAGKVWGMDIDEQALAIAAENAVLNGVSPRMRIGGTDISTIDGAFDLVLANLTANVLLELQPRLETLLSPGGYLIISGIIEQQGPEIEAKFSRPPLRLKRTIEGAEWRCYVFCKD